MPPVENTNVEQSFDDAFAEALAAEPKPDEKPANAAAATTAQDPPAGEPKPAATAAGAEEPSGEAAAAAVEVAATAPAPAPAAAPPAAESPEQELARLRAENAALNAVGRFAERAAEAAPAPVAPAAPAPPAQPQWYQPAAEEVERVQSFQKEWPDIHEAVQVLLKQAGYNAAEYVFHTIAKVYNPTLQEFALLSKTIQEQLALGALRSEHNDYDNIYENVVAWVDTLSPAFKRGVQQVMESGTPEEVNDLIAAYKQTDTFKQQAAATGGANQAAVPAAPAAVQPTGLSAAAKKAAGRLQVVGSKRTTTPVAPADANDFDGAWAEAMRSN